MNFFEHQAHARAASRRMIVLFALSVIGVVVFINLGVLAALGAAGAFGPDADPELRDKAAGILITTTVLTLGVILVASLFKTLSLGRGGGAVAQAMGATLVPEDTRDFHLKRLRNVVEEMSIAASMPVPEIYVMEQEAGINAFAAGFGTADAAVAVTRGALEKLSRDELQGVIAHEFSHILNGDMRLNMRLMGVIFGLLVLGIGGRKVLENLRGSSSRDGKAIVLIALVFMIFGYLGVLFGRLIKANISRQREYLADASAVQFTRLSSGISGALKKIAGFSHGAKLEREDGEEVAHMLFGDGVGYSSWFATHPPLIERIQRIEPGFNPGELNQLAAAERVFRGVGEDFEAPSAVALLAPGGLDSIKAARTKSRESAPAPTPPPLPKASRQRAPSAAEVVRSVGNPGDAHVRYAEAVRRTLPPILKTAAHMRERALDVILCLLLAPAGLVRAEQLKLIAEQLGEARREGVEHLEVATLSLHPAQRMPLALLAFPALKRRPAGDLNTYATCIEALIHADGKVDVFEYCLGRLVRQQLRQMRQPAEQNGANLKIIECRQDVAALLAILAQHGHPAGDAARRAFQAGMHEVLPGSSFEYQPPSAWAEVLDGALDRLDRLQPLGKERLIAGLAVTVGHDGDIATSEAELLRLVCSLLHCPLPPFIEG